MKMWPFELMATPTASAMIMSRGIFRKSWTTWKVSSGAFGTSAGLGASCAYRDTPNRRATESIEYFIALPFQIRFHVRTGRPNLWSRVQGELLNAPIRNFTRVDFVVGPAVKLMHRHELLQRLAALPELAQDFAVQFHFVDLAVVGHIRRASGVGAVEILMLARRDADCPRRAHIDIARLVISVVVKD